MFFAKRFRRSGTAKPQGKAPALPTGQNTGTALSVFGPSTAKLTTPLELGGLPSGQVTSLEGSTLSRIPIVIKGDLQRPAVAAPNSCWPGWSRMTATGTT